MKDYISFVCQEGVRYYLLQYSRSHVCEQVEVLLLQEKVCFICQLISKVFPYTGFKSSTDSQSTDSSQYTKSQFQVSAWRLSVCIKPKFTSHNVMPVSFFKVNHGHSTVYI